MKKNTPRGTKHIAHTMTRNFLIFSLLLAALALTACHTTEENYRTAYEKAVEKTRLNMGEELYDEIQAERRRDNYVIDGDSIRLLRCRYNVVDDKNDVARKYGVVVGEFKQKFNAQNYCGRLKKERHNSFVAYYHKDRTYFVVIESYDDVAVAAAFMRIMDQKTKIPPAVPMPWVVERL